MQLPALHVSCCCSLLPSVTNVQFTVVCCTLLTITYTVAHYSLLVLTVACHCSLLPAVRYSLLRAVVHYNCLSVVHSNCCSLLRAVAHCCLLLPSFLLLPTASCCFSLLTNVAHCHLLLFTVACCCSLLPTMFTVVCLCSLLPCYTLLL